MVSEDFESGEEGGGNEESPGNMYVVSSDCKMREGVKVTPSKHQRLKVHQNEGDGVTGLHVPLEGSKHHCCLDLVAVGAND